MVSGVYKIINTKNSHCYIGSAVNILRRWGTHRRQLQDGEHHSIYLQRAWDKYGDDAFQFRKLIICSKENLLMYEQRCLDELAPDYNISLVADNPVRGRKHSQESRSRLSAAIKSMWTDEHRSKMCAMRVGHKVSDITKAKISKALMGNKSRTGLKHTAAARAKISEAHLRNARARAIKEHVE